MNKNKDDSMDNNESRKKKNKRYIGLKLLIHFIGILVLAGLASIWENYLAGIVTSIIGGVALTFITKKIIEAKQIKESVGEFIEDPKRATLNLVLKNWKILPDKVKDKIIDAYDNVQETKDKNERAKSDIYMDLVQKLMLAKKKVRENNIDEANSIIHEISIIAAENDFQQIIKEAQSIH